MKLLKLLEGLEKGSPNAQGAELVREEALTLEVRQVLRTARRVLCARCTVLLTFLSLIVTAWWVSSSSFGQ